MSRYNDILQHVQTALHDGVKKLERITPQCLKRKVLEYWNFVWTHYSYIILNILICFPLIYLGGNLTGINAFLLAASACTGSGLSPVDLYVLNGWQQGVLFTFPILTNVLIIHPVALLCRLCHYTARQLSELDKLLDSLPQSSYTTLSEESSESTSRAPGHEAYEMTRVSRPPEGESNPLLERPEAHDRDDTAEEIQADIRTGHLLMDATDHAIDHAIDSGRVSVPAETVDQRETAGADGNFENDGGVDAAAAVEHSPLITTDTDPDQSSNAMSNANAPEIVAARPLTGDARSLTSGADRPGEHIQFAEEARATLRHDSGLSRVNSRSQSQSRAARAAETVAHTATNIAAHIPPVASELASHIHPLAIVSNILVPGPHEPRSTRTSLSWIEVERPPITELERIEKTRRKATEFRDALVEKRRALKVLAYIVIAYPLIMFILGFAALMIWATRFMPPALTSYLASQRLDKFWWAFFTTGSMLGNVGFTLTADSMGHLAGEPFPTWVSTCLCYAGNTGIPIALYVIIWTVSAASRSVTLCRGFPWFRKLREPLRYLLDNPRRCYTLLFRRRLTVCLFVVLLLFNVLEISLIQGLDKHNPAVQLNYDGTKLKLWDRLMATLFQAVNTRHTGASIFNVSLLKLTVQLLLGAMMFMEAYPLTMGMRVDDPGEDGPGRPRQFSEWDYLRKLVRDQIAFDGFFILAGSMIILGIEEMNNEELEVTVWNILFEVTSAYCNVGLSLGAVGVTTSLCGEFCLGSKLVVCGLMLIGRHRGLPYPAKAVTPLSAFLAKHANGRVNTGDAAEEPEPEPDRQEDV